MVFDLKTSLVALIGVAGAISVLCYVRMVHRLKINHPTVWRDLGEPGFLKRSAFEQRKKESFESFLFRRSYNLLDDPVLTAYGNIALVTVSLSIIMAIIGTIFLSDTAVRF